MNQSLEELRNKLKSQASTVLTIPAILCFITFITNLIQALKDGNIDCNELHQLLSTADGFETVVLSIIIMVLREKKK